MKILLMTADEDSEKKLKEFICPFEAEVVVYKNMAEFVQNKVGFDYGFIDLTDIFADNIPLLGLWDTAVKVLEHFMEENPSAKYFLFSSVSTWASSVIEEIRQDLPDFDILIAYSLKEFADKIKEDNMQK